MNHNVRASLALCVLSGIADSTWSGTVIAAFILVSSGSNTTVGLVEAAQGLATLIFALPIGYMADVYGRSPVIAAGGVLCLIASAATTYVVLDVEREASMSNHAMGALVVVMVMWGCVGGIISGPSQALYADSIPTGERSKWYNYLFAAYIISSAVGPLIAICVFSLTEDQWTLQELRIVIVAGMVAEVGCALVMFTFSDKAALGSQAGTAQVAAAADAPLPAEVPLLADVPAARTAVALPPDALSADAVAPDEAASVDEVGAAGEEETGANGSEHAPAPEDEASGEAEADGAPAAVLPAPDDSAPVVCAPPPPRLAPGAAGVAASAASARAVARVPYILFASSLLSALGSGCTVKFFPLFFKQDCKLSPRAVQGIYVCVPFVMVACSTLVQRLSATFGRVQCIVLARASGVCLLLVMAWLQLRSGYEGVALVLVPIYIARTALMNAGYPLEESILMDFVPKSTRARWKSLESISQFGWCGSAALGGWLGDRFGYSYTFLITAMIQGAAVLLMCTLLPVVPRREADGAAHALAHGCGEPEAGTAGASAATPRAPAPREHATAGSSARGTRAKPAVRGLPAQLQEPLLDVTADHD